QWHADGTTISGATGSSFLLTQAEVGKAISVIASYTDGFGQAESVSSAATALVANVNDAPTGLPTITGTALEGQTLRADVAAIADVDGLGAISYQWLRDGRVIAGATGPSHLLGNADVGALLSVRVSYTDGQGTAESLDSAASSAVIGVNETPVLSAPLAGQTATLGARFQFTLPEGSFTDPDIGDTLRYSVTLDSGAALPSWLVFDATTRSFSGTPGASDLGVITLRVTATDSLGLSAEASLTITTVLGTLPEPVQVVEAPAEAQPEAEAAAPVAPASKPEPVPPAVPVDATAGLPPAPLFAATVIDTAVPAPARSGTSDETPPTTRAASHSVSVSVPVAQEAMAFGNLNISPMQNLLRSDELLRRFDTLRQQLALPEELQRTAVAQSIAVTSGLSIGYVVWLVRGGVLMSSMLSALPAWQMIDPMPVLAAAKPRRRKDGLPDEEDT
ncbi:MAG: putative Ig domain-containing protein, partial [Rubrivivax sp.]|nr:putative Ig domain-containing protein [Rubrivivax sp.]